MKLLKFYADFCNPCRVLTTMLDGFDACPMEKVNIDLDADRTSQYSIRSIPTLVLIDDNGNELWRHSGLIDKVMVEKAARKHK